MTSFLIFVFSVAVLQFHMVILVQNLLRCLLFLFNGYSFYVESINGLRYNCLARKKRCNTFYARVCTNNLSIVYLLTLLRKSSL